MLPVCRLQITIGIVVCFLLLHARCADEYTDQNRPYEFGFKIDGQQHRHEKKDKDGIIMGEFGFITADDVYHVTVYATDKEGRFKILSMKNIHLKSSQTSPSRDGYSRALQPSATPSQPEKPPPQPQQIPAIATRNSFESVSLEPPVKSCSSCSIPTTSTQAPPPAPPTYNQDDYNNPIQAGQSPPTNQRGVPNSPNNSPQYTLSNAPSYPQQQGAQPVYLGQIENNPGSQQPYANNQESGFGSQGPNAQAQPQSNPNSLGKALSNPSNPAQTDLSEREPKQYSGPPQDFGTNTGIPQSQNIPQGQIFSQEPNYPQGSDFPQTQNYPQGQNFPQTQNYPQGQNFPQTQNFPQGQNFPLTQNYPQGQNFPQSQNYPQGPNFPEGQNNPQGQNFPQTQNYPQGPNFPEGQNNPQGQNFPQTQNYPQGSSEATGTAPNKPTLVSAQMQIVDKNTDIHRLSPGETAGLPPGLSKHDMVQLLYTFNYTLSFQGHFEEGYSNGVKKGYYFVTGRDGVKRRIDYVADDTGFHPKVSSEVLDVLSDDVPKPETEKDAKYGLKGYEFKWLYYPVDS